MCSAKPKDLPLEPRCIYRSPDPDPEGLTLEPEAIPESTNPRVWELSKANGRFALSFYRQLALTKTPQSNIFLSPISISTAFAMTKLGACDQTLQQIMKVFEFDSIKEKTSDQVHFFFAKLICRLFRKKDESTELISANRLFGEKSLVFNETYQNISENVYGSVLQEDPEGARATINDWISNKTENRIQDTLPPGSLDSTTVLVLVNTIYFKGQWKNKFDSHNTQFRYQFYPQDKVQVLEMPYSGDDITMVLILPSRDATLTQVVEENLDLTKLTKWLNGMKETNVALHVPRFRVEDSMSLREKLEAMGLTDLFWSVYMLTRVLTDLFPLQVTEEGSEAAAATGVVAVGRSINLNREVFLADRPFLLLIRESTINALLFIGRVVTPCSP
uniref:Antithrombin-III n=1 Tax=Echeneis naucrates TaxID=173247 RepID=A0A665U4B7_ECHNA